MVNPGGIQISEVVQVEDKHIVITENTDNLAILIVIIASGAIILMIIACIVRYFYNKLRMEKARAE